MLSGFGREIGLVSFDLDDTLVDTFGSVPARVRAALQAMRPRIAVDDEAIDLIALDIASGNHELRNIRLIEAMALQTGDPLAAELLESFAGNTSLIRLIDGAIEVLEYLHGNAHLAVITNGFTTIQRRKIEHHRLDRFITTVVTSEAAMIAKPDLAIFQQACSMSGIDPRHAVHIGDSPATDVLGAKAAGFATVLLRTSVPYISMDEEPEPDVEIERLTDLLQLLRTA